MRGNVIAVAASKRLVAGTKESVASIIRKASAPSWAFSGIVRSFPFWRGSFHFAHFPAHFETSDSVVSISHAQQFLRYFLWIRDVDEEGKLNWTQENVQFCS